MTVAVGIFDFNDYAVKRSEGVKGLFEILNGFGETVDLVTEERDGFLVSEIYPFRSYLLQ